ncbi:hypothetical protein Tco_0999523 [Tanacetum coccineum]
MNMALVLTTKAFKLIYTTPTNNNQRISSNPCNRHIAQPGQIAGKSEWNGLIVVPGIANQNGNGNVIAAQVEGNGNRNNANQIRCYNYRGVGHYVRNEVRINQKSQENSKKRASTDTRTRRVQSRSQKSQASVKISQSQSKMVNKSQQAPQYSILTLDVSQKSKNSPSPLNGP